DRANDPPDSSLAARSLPRAVPPGAGRSGRRVRPDGARCRPCPLPRVAARLCRSGVRQCPLPRFSGAMPGPRRPRPCPMGALRARPGVAVPIGAGPGPHAARRCHAGRGRGLARPARRI
ncbi:MAG: hypothetical protein AVDCRST_MAG19-4715, partial [uncultured Thermomicrobiales bacterium]